MNSHIWKYYLGWGVGLWFFGYLLGIILFVVVPPAFLGWVIMPLGIAITLWVLFKKIELPSLSRYVWLGAVWTGLAVLLDYFLLVQVFKPTDGYYKLDVYLYYLLTFVLPVLVGWKKKQV
jgi:hypothetical protein